MSNGDIDPAFKSAWRESQGQPVDSAVLNRRAAAPQEPAPEPVAWREKDFASGRYVYGSPKEVRAAHGVGAIVEPLYASPQPANPAQVADAIRGIVEDALNSAIPEPWEVAEHATQRILAAIGAGGQAVASLDDVAARMWKADAEDSGTPVSVAAGRTREAFDDQAEELKARWRKFAKAASSVLFLPHPADERVVESLWNPLTHKDDKMTCPMPADETVVEVMLRDGTVCRAWHSCNIMDAGDWDFLPVKDDGEPDDEADSIASAIVAWRPAAPDRRAGE